ncbi:hypothetical protein C6V83_18075 [Gordonia iterans]|uniref:DUF3168 domain-containing protein n=1 Tax=Gordonia iterans TaxID=1004901 RepID=A0A2S0KJQ9_9ACTN|nr:hypothetical protein [Gordonia iterans]AVM01886.1 hypothetical protein C6V83_18075 [Gordonia iterans]
MIPCGPYPVAMALLAHLQAHLTETRAGAPDRVAVFPHDMPAGEFCDQAWVGYRSVTPMTTPKGGCASMWRAELTLGVTRCYPVMRDNGAPPAAHVDSAARDIADDLEAMQRAVRDALHGVTYTLGSWRPLNPQGGQHGSRLDVTVEIQLGAHVEPGAPMLPGDPRADNDGGEP